MNDTPTYKGWRNVPSGLFSKTQLRELDLPREVGALRGPVGFCGPCCDRAEAKGHTIRREPLTRVLRTRGEK